MTQSFKKSLAALGCFVTLPALAGPFVSGGGELIKDAGNPWYLDNVKEVRYCVALDEANFSARRMDVERAIEEAIKYWKEEFKTAVNPLHREPSTGKTFRVNVATQDFVKEECQASTELRFQFGVLDRVQLEYLRDPRNYVGIAVRTEYDAVNLKGKGFIYISPDKGPWRFNLDDAEPTPWSNFHTLYGVLIHEVGHVFGVAHTHDSTLMSANFPERLIRKRPSFNMDKKAPSFFRSPVYAISGYGAKKSCNYKFGFDKAYPFFGIPSHHGCVGFELTVPDSDDKRVLKVLSSEDNLSKLKVVGTAEFAKGSFGEPDLSVAVVLNPLQKVLPPSRYFNNLWMGPMRVFERLKGEFKNSSTGLVRPMAILGSNRMTLQMVGELDGEPIINLLDEDGM